MSRSALVPLTIIPFPILGKGELRVDAKNAISVSEQSVLVIFSRLSSISSLSFANPSHDWYWHWYYAFYALLAWQTAALLWKFWWKAPV